MIAASTLVPYFLVQGLTAPIVWNLLSASAALFALILAVNRVGDAVRDVLDPRVSGGNA